MPLKLKPPRKGKTPFWSVRGTHLGIYVDRTTGLTERAKAGQILRKWKEEIERGEFARPGEATFLSASIAYVTAGREGRFVDPLSAYFVHTPLTKIDQAAIDSAAEALYPNATPATRNRQVHTVVSAILKHAGIDHKLKRPKGSQGMARTEWLWPEQAFKIFYGADASDPEFGLFLRFLCYTGLRLSEALNLGINDVRLAESFAYVAETKNEDPRAVFLPPNLVAALANHPRGMEREGRVFRFRKDGRLYRLLARAKNAAGADVAFVGFHTFRHTWATWMRRYGGLDTRGLIGTGAWRDAKSVDRYQHVVVSEEAAKAARLPTERNAMATSGKPVEKRGRGGRNAG